MKKNLTWINTRTEWQWDGEKYVEVSNQGYWYYGGLALAHNTPNLDQDSYAFYNDGTESGSTIIGTANNSQSLNVDTTYHVRFLIQEDNGGDSSNWEGILEYDLNNSGTYTAVNATSNVVRSTAGGLTEDGNTTQRLGSGTFLSTNGGQDEVDGTTLVNGISFTGNTEVEVVFSFQIRSADVNNGDTVTLRVQNVNTYTNTATATVVEATVNPGTASFTGGGTLSVTGGVLNRAATASFTGAGTFSAVGEYLPGVTTYPGTASFTGAGSFTGNGAHVYKATASFTGGGTFAGIGEQITKYFGTASFAGGSSLVTTTRMIYGGTASFDGAGTFSAVGQYRGTNPGTASFTGAGTLAATGSVRYAATASFTGGSSFAGVGDTATTNPGVASFTGGSSLVTTPNTKYAANANFVGGGTLLTLVEQAAPEGAGGRPKKKRKKQSKKFPKPLLTLPDGTVVEVENKAEAQRLLDEYYLANQPTKKAPKLTRKEVEVEDVGSEQDQPEEIAYVYSPRRIIPVLPDPGNIVPTAMVEARYKQLIKRRREEEAILLLIA